MKNNNFNDNEKSNIEFIQKTLKLLDDTITPPLSVSAEYIINKAENSREKNKKRAMFVTAQRLTAAVVCAAFCVWCVFGYNLFLNNPTEQPQPLGIPKITSSQETTFSNDDEIENPYVQLSEMNLEEYGDVFKTLSKVIKTNERVYADGFLWDEEATTEDAMPSTDGANAAIAAEIGGDMGGSVTKEKSKEIDSGETNTQVEGVDEADIIKNDGQYLYILSNQMKDESDIYKYAFSIVDVQEPDNLNVLSEIEINKYAGKGTQLIPLEMYLNSGKAVIICNVDNQEDRYPNVSYMRGFFPSTIEKIKVLMFDVTDKSKVKLVDTFTQSGEYVSSRVIGQTAYLVTNFHIDTIGFDDSNITTDEPETNNSKGKSLDEIGVPELNITNEKALECIPSAYYGDGVSYLRPEAITVDKNAQQPEYMVVSALDLAEKGKSNSQSILGCGSDIFCSVNNLYAAQTIYERNATTSTTVTKVSLDKLKIEVKESATFRGNILNQFSMDEYKGNFRTVVTYQNAITGINRNALLIFDKNMKVIGKIENMAPDERIYSARFMGDKIYMVTFREVDPLFVIDASNPRKPKVLGELKIPGFSEYLHPISDTLLLGIGMQASDKGMIEGIKLSMFDVSNPLEPTEKFVKIIGDGKGDYHTDVAHSHKSVLFWNDLSKFAFAVKYYDVKNNYIYFEDYTVFEIGKNGFKELGKVSHLNDNSIKHYEELSKLQIKYDTTTYMDEATRRARQDAYEKELWKLYDKYDTNNTKIKRGTYIEDTLFTISDRIVQAHSLDNFKLLSQVELQAKLK